MRFNVVKLLSGELNKLKLLDPRFGLPGFAGSSLSSARTALYPLKSITFAAWKLMKSMDSGGGPSAKRVCGVSTPKLPPKLFCGYEPPQQAIIGLLLRTEAPWLVSKISVVMPSPPPLLTIGAARLARAPNNNKERKAAP
jgi:hypothetical protein